MLFNSLSFAFFLPIVFIVYWLLNRNLKLQNLCLLVSSCYFYGSWDYRFLFLLLFSISLDYFTGIKMFEAKDRNYKRFWFWLSIGINLGFLGVFKYFNFFAESFADFLSLFGLEVSFWTINVILPVGISFYTFHGLSYVIDIYKGRIEPEKSFINYSVFVSFFPLLVAGPIERATHLLPQIQKERRFEFYRAADGLRQILWGLFKKIVIADNCAEFANFIFANTSNSAGSTLVFGALFFTFQIYCDFSGYSDIALGTARLFGIDLLRNFSFPYFSRDIAEFWRRWHISLSSWFRDYLYIPLGGSKGGTRMKVRNTFVIFLVSGFWHGANWTFIVWGLLNALYIMPSIFRNTNRNNLDIVAKGKSLPSLRDLLSILITFCLTAFAWIFFRANSLDHALEYISGIVSRSLFTHPDLNLEARILLVLIGLFMMVEWLGREHHYALAGMNRNLNRPLRWASYFTLILAIIYFGGKEQTFIYFQF